MGVSGLEHVGSAHTEAELGVLLQHARGLLENPAQGVLELGVEPTPPVRELVAPARDPVLFDIAGTVAPRGRGARHAWSARTRASSSLRWPACLRRWDSTGSVTRCSVTW